MRVNLFGLGTLSKSRAITAQRRINCYVEPRKEMDRTAFALVVRPGLDQFADLGVDTSRGFWPVNTIATPVLFTVHGNTLYSVNNAGTTTAIGVIGTSTGNVSMADDGTYLVLVDGTNGYVYNMMVPAGLNQIVDGNFTTSPSTVTWQDQYFIVTSHATKQFQLSQISPGIDPMVWPAIQINFAGSGPDSLQAGISDHSILNLFAETYTEFWQNAGNPDFPFAKIPGSAQEFGLNAPFSLTKFDNSVIGLFQNTMGGRNVSRMQGFSLNKLSDQDIDEILTGYIDTSDANGFSFMNGGHPLYVLTLPAANATWVYDGLPNAWFEWTDENGDRFWGQKFAKFLNRLLVSDYRSGLIYEINGSTYSDVASPISMEVWSKHIWEDDKYLGIQQIQVDIESGVGTLTETDPVVDLLVSKDGGNTFNSIGFSQMGAIGEYTTRVIWNSLGAAKDWVLRLRITDNVKRVITGASAVITGGSF